MIKDFLFFWFILLKDILFTPYFFIKATLKSLYTHLCWKRFSGLYHIEHLVVYNDFALQHIIRNILLSRINTKTWYYLHSRNFGDLYIPSGNRESYRHHRLLYLYYDNLVSWGGAEAFFKKQPHNINNFLHLGCLWSEHVHSISKSQALTNLGITRRDDSFSNNIVGVFDTTFGEISPLKYKDMVLFIEGILQLLEDFPKVSVVFKEKNPRDEVHPDVISYLEKMESHPRCFVPGCKIETPEVIKVSDLVISACFTSPTVESLGAKRKAIYFDASDKWRGVYYDRFPNLVAHDYNGLKEIVNFWLYQITDREFDNYLETYIEKESNIWIDGKAITSLRELLTRRN